ncbi:MAG: DegT/DnrJ/EryC1/StrS family aminotransferase, partial [Candidatus Marsarchaeota archaeon]|nr:DegT/DnrJ/EryC1/StrS family aminotransferase [Candidatus Marsarchaeota archaeon]
MKRNIGVGDLKISRYEKKLVKRVLDSNRLSYGPMTKSFEKRFAQLHDSRFAIFTNSGTSCLQIAIAALKEKYNWKDGDEIIVPSTTFVATPNTVIYNNMKPVFVDVDPHTFNINVKKIEEKVTEKTVAIIAVHLLGLPADMGPILDLAKKYGLKVIEDSAETMFASYKGRRVGSIGAIGCFSTYVAHHIVTGVGGLCTTSDPELAVIIRSLANHGRDSIYINIDDDSKRNGKQLNEIIARRFNFVRYGFSYRCTEIEAAIGLGQLKRK